jgi:hypothetical protein
MTPERFASLLASYGGNLDRWPAAEQDAARAHLQTHPTARTALSDAARLDAVLAAWVVPGPGSVLAARIAAIAAGQAPPLRRLLRWWSGVVAATALATGLAAGALAVEALAPQPEPRGAGLYGLTVLGAPLDLKADGSTNGPA